MFAGFEAVVKYLPCSWWKRSLVLLAKGCACTVASINSGKAACYLLCRGTALPCTRGSISSYTYPPLNCHKHSLQGARDSGKRINSPEKCLGISVLAFSSRFSLLFRMPWIRWFATSWPSTTGATRASATTPPTPTANRTWARTRSDELWPFRRRRRRRRAGMRRSDSPAPGPRSFRPRKSHSASAKKPNSSF